MANWRLSLPDSISRTSSADAAASAPTIYCPYADKDIPLGDSNPEHIISLALGGLNTFTLPVSKDFNSRIGSEIDGALANDFLVMAKRDKHLVKGHSGKEPEFVTRKASDAETGAPLKVTLGQRKGLQIWSPTEKRNLTGLGKQVNTVHPSAPSAMPSMQWRHASIIASGNRKLTMTKFFAQCVRWWPRTPSWR